MSFLTEADDTKYKAEKATMLKQKQVITIEELITPDGRIELSHVDVERVRDELAKKVTRVST